MQVMNQWAQVKELLYKYALGFKPTQHGAWRNVLDARPRDSIIHVYKLYVLSRLIVTQSADVERGFSMLVSTLGLARLRTSTQTLDARLRIKQFLPSDPSRDDLQFLGAMKPEDGSDTDANPHELYSELLKSDGVVSDFLSYQLHKATGIQSDSFWTETLAQEFSAVDNVVSFEGEETDTDEEERTWQGVPVSDLVQLLTSGLEDNAVEVD
jgi:hypothetical protein